MKRVSEKLRSQHGMALLIVILAAAIIVMSLIIIVPELNEIKEQERVEQDSGHEQVAEDSAYMKYASDGSFEAVYDAVGKTFVDSKDVLSVEPYGNCKEHQGMVLVVEADEEGDVEVTWVDPKEYYYSAHIQEQK